VVWPARWGNAYLDVQHYRHILNDELYNAYTAKEQAKAKDPPSTPVIPDGLTRGVDLQICPNPLCKKLICLATGCNHIVCEACLKNFCFICGEEAYAGTASWTQDCPRYHARSAANAQYDRLLGPREVALQAQQTVTFDADDVVMTRPSIMGWNIAMQTASLETRNLLLRFVDASGPLITEDHRQGAVAAMGTHNPLLSGMPDYEWYDRRVVALRRMRDHQFLEMLLIAGVAEVVRFNPAAPPATGMHINTGPFENLLREPIARVFFMDLPMSRETAYRWIIAYHRDHAEVTGHGLPEQDNSAVLTGIRPDELPGLVHIFERISPRHRTRQLSDTSVVLSIHGDTIGNPHAPLIALRMLQQTL
jgi:hypothetical protein